MASSMFRFLRTELLLRQLSASPGDDMIPAP